MIPHLPLSPPLSGLLLYFPLPLTLPLPLPLHLPLPPSLPTLPRSLTGWKNAVEAWNEAAKQSSARGLEEVALDFGALP